ncbi:tetratricopeptide repeat protein [Candidatus Aerophobetes bacterium]|uniref:Tetratricopeptide repeat protein n=1 Tax=Aerophobetes bacterium TaxID=2030807 RepID=A0A523TAH4_UNCAE|nr:MAG: tetratricopeptide repeat protein [Candidatus Aerophobetes bacterium]
MKRDWKQRWFKLLKIDRKKFFFFVLLGAGIITFFLILSLFSYRINQKAQADFELATSHYRKAQNSQEEKRREEYEEAKSLYNDILARFLLRDKKKVLFYLGSSLYYLEEYREAARIFQRFVDRYGRDYFSPWVEIRLAASYEEIGEFQKAIKVYQLTLREHPESALAPQGNLGIARCRELQAKWQEAQKAYQELISRYPLSPEKEIAEARIQWIKVKGQGS